MNLAETLKGFDESDHIELALWQQAYLAALGGLGGSAPFTYDDASISCVKHSNLFVRKFRAKVRSIQARKTKQE